MTVTLFRNVRILDCAHGLVYAGSVLVEGNRIEATAPVGRNKPLNGLVVAMFHIQPPHGQPDKQAENYRNGVDGKMRGDHPGVDRI